MQALIEYQAAYNAPMAKKCNLGTSGKIACAHLKNKQDSRSMMSVGKVRQLEGESTNPI